MTALSRQRTQSLIASRPRAQSGEAQRFLDTTLEMIDYGPDCIPWPFALSGSGHATLRGQTVGRIILDLHPGDGYVAMHSCHRPECINPSHLLVGTPADNAQMMIDAGRHRSGSVA